MRHKRIAASEARAAAKVSSAEAVRERAATKARSQAAAKARPATAPDPEEDVTPWLRQLGFRADEARRAAARCEAMPDTSLEDRVKFALSTLARCRPWRAAARAGAFPGPWPRHEARGRDPWSVSIAPTQASRRRLPDQEQASSGRVAGRANRTDGATGRRAQTDFACPACPRMRDNHCRGGLESPA